MARSGEKNPGAFMSHPFLLSAASHRRWLDRRERRARSRASNGRRVFVMRRRAPLRSRGQGTFSTSISHTSFPLPMKHRLGGVDRLLTTASGATNGEGAWVAATITAATCGPGQFLSRRMEAWRPRLILFSAQFEFRTATTLLCAAIVSFRSLIPRFIPAISAGNS